MRNTRPPRPPPWFSYGLSGAPSHPPHPPPFGHTSEAVAVFRARWVQHVKAIPSAIGNLMRFAARPWRRFQAWRCGRAWDKYFRTDPIVLLQQREAEANLELWEADRGLARELGVAPTFRGRSGRIVVCFEWEPRPGNPSMVRPHFIFADGDEGHGPWDLATAVSVHKAESWS